MTVVELDLVKCIDTTLDEIRRAMTAHELEMAWVAGLGDHRINDQRDQILAVAGSRLGLFDEPEAQWVSHCWLRQVGDEVRLRGDQPLSDDLVGIAKSEMREVFASASEDFERLRPYVEAGEDAATITERFTQSAMLVRDLGRIAQQLQGSGLTALVPKEHIEFAVGLADDLRPPEYLDEVVPEPLRITRDDLIRWSETLNARGELPRLVRRLIAETTAAEHIHFPSGTGVSKPSWDGIVECERGNRFVPTGRSRWELSVAKSNPHRKATADYEKRVNESTTEDKTKTTYVAVICATWTKAPQFAEEKTKEGHFRSVRALNVDDLEAWLGCAPATTVWLRSQIGEHVTGFRPLADWWKQWLESTRIPLDRGIVLAGRNSEATKLRNRCSQRHGGVITIGGSVHRDEIIAFVAATLCTPSNSTQHPTDVIYVDNNEAAQQLLGLKSLQESANLKTRRPLTALVPSKGFAGFLPAGSSNQMIVPVPGSPQADIVLESVDSRVVSQQLHGAGEDIHTADQLGSIARMSLLALRRILAVNPELYRPVWATSPVDVMLRRSLLLGGWDANREGDQQMLERFVGKAYSEITEALHQLNPGDAPLSVTSDRWHATAPSDTWTLLVHNLTRDDIRAFSEVAHEVLLEPNPLYGLSGDKLIQARFNGTRARYSSALKRGIATTLALIGSKPPTRYGTITPDSAIASDVVSSVLKSANEDANAKTWAAVVEVLPLLAEAAPDTVLAALRECLSEPHEFANAIFTDSEIASFDRLPSPHFQILRALEIVAWSPEHLMAVVDVLAKLAELDPGGTYANRPAESLSAIMCSWMPQTAAREEERLAAIQMLRRGHNSVAWPLMLSMLPNQRRTQRRKLGPQFRDWRTRSQFVSHAEQERTAVSILELLIEDAGNDPVRWGDLIQTIFALRVNLRAQLIAALEDVAMSGTEETFKSAVFPRLQALLALCRTHSNTNSALSENELAQLEMVLERLQPTDIAIVYRDRFSSGLMSIDGVSKLDGWDSFHEALRAKQTEAMEAVHADGGLAAVLVFAESVEIPYQVGTALAGCAPSLDPAILEEMDGASEVVAQLALGYFCQRFRDIGWDGFDTLLIDHDLEPQVVADLLRAATSIESAWKRAKAIGEEVAAHFWAKVRVLELGIPKDQLELLEVSRHLRDANRVELALVLLTRDGETNAPSLEFAEEAAACLEQWIRQPPQPVPSDQTDWQLTNYCLTTLIKVLDEHRDNLGSERVVSLEWQYYSVLCDSSDFKAPNLYREMTANPDFFVQLVEIAFQPAGLDSVDPPEPTDAEHQLALNAYQVLHSWPDSQFAPRLSKDDRIDATALNNWIDHARERLREIDRADIGDVMIGTALASSPTDPNGEWPTVPVRDLIERLENERLENGLCIALLNQRGVTCRSPDTGGDQERDRASQFCHQAHQIAAWPRTAAILTQLAEDYDRTARMIDREAESHRRGLPYG